MGFVVGVIFGLYHVILVQWLGDVYRNKKHRFFSSPQNAALSLFCLIK